MEREVFDYVLGDMDLPYDKKELLMRFANLRRFLMEKKDKGDVWEMFHRRSEKSISAFYGMEDEADKIQYLELWREQISTSIPNKFLKEVCIFFSPANKYFTAAAFNRMGKHFDNFHKHDRLSSLNYSSITLENKKDTKQTYSFIPKEEVIGREDDKKQIIEMLLHDIKTSVIAIVGVGGLGKTTLAQFVFNDDKIGAYFDHLFWVSVSEAFDLNAILMKIIESVNKKSVFRSKVTEVEPDQLLSHLLTELDGKLFFLVLDDLSIHDFQDWHILEQMFDRGARGSKILITTRSDQTAMICRAHCYRLQGLSDENSWSLFQRLAFDSQELSKNPNMVKIGTDIVKKCRNVPLIIRLVANLLYQKDINKWTQFRDENMDIMDAFTRNRKGDLLKVLRPSYDDLPSHLKHCFAYCALFPKGYEFNNHDLVHLWMAQGFIIFSPEKNDDCSLEDVALECILGLLGRCFFQDVKTDVLGDIISFRMDDMMLHLAQNIAGQSVITSSDFARYDVSALHMSVRFNGSFPEALFRAHRIRTLLLTKEPEYEGKLDRSICQMLILKFKHLRALDLHDCGIDILPSSVGDLIHLRYLDLSKNDGLMKLPKSVTKLYYLQTLKLNSCQKLQRLPKDIGKLIQLRCLEIEECDGLAYMPLGLINLACLHNLNRFVVHTPTDEDNRSGGIRVLKTLNSLRGKLKIELSGRWTSIVHEAPEANLRCKTNLKDLKIEWRLGGLDDEHAYYYYGAFLEGLQPPTSLRVLCIEGYRGKDFPSWARMDKLTSSLPNLVIVSMEGCRECKYLPPFGQLKFLKCLTLRYMEQVQHVENGTYDPQTSSAPTMFFPSLGELTLHSFHNLKGWWKEVGVMQSYIPLPSFPRLSKLKIWNCPNLTVMPLFPHVEEVDFQNVNKNLLGVSARNTASTSISTIPASTSPSSSCTPSTLDNCTTLSLVHSRRVYTSGCLQDLYDLKRLHIKNCPSLKSFPIITDRIASSVQYLVVEKCDALTSVVEGLQHLKALKELELLHCEELNFGVGKHNTSFPWNSLTNLRYLTFRGLPKMYTLPEGLQEIKSLKFLWIATCSSLIELPEWIDQISSLQHLRIEACPMLTQMPQNMCRLKSLIKLEVMECSKLMERCREPKGKDWPKIRHIPRVLLHKSWRYGLMNDAETTETPKIIQ